MANKITFTTEDNQTKATFDYDNLQDVTNTSTSVQAGGGGTEVEANPEGTATDTLTKIGIDNTIYSVGSSNHLYWHSVTMNGTDFSTAATGGTTVSENLFFTILSTSPTPITHQDVLTILDNGGEIMVSGYIEPRTVIVYYLYKFITANRYCLFTNSTESGVQYGTYYMSTTAHPTYTDKVDQIF